MATGGTISNRSGGRLTAEELVESMPGLDRYVRPEFEQFANVASGSLTLQNWLELARRINTLFAQDTDLAGVVVTSGTDTLEETAYFLDLTVHSDKPVVVVGSMRNPSTLGYEGAANLLEGFRVAAEPASRGKGALVVLNDEINSAREVTKTDALRLNTFQSRGYGILGVVDADRVVYYRDVVKRHTKDSEFDVSQIEALPRVDIVMVYQGASGDIIKAMVDLGAKGIVIASAGAGATSGTQGEGNPVRHREGRVRGHEHPHGQRPDRRPPPPGRGGRAERLPDCGRRPHAGQGAHPADARADEDAERRGHSADVHRVLNPSRPSGLSGGGCGRASA